MNEPEHAIATVYEPSALAAANDAAGGDAEPEEPASTAETAEGPAEESASGSDAETPPKE
jgi:hypothetical protein